MLELHEYSRLDAVALRQLIRSREVSALEIEAAARRAISTVDVDLNALTLPLFEPSLSHDPGGMFGGVPMLIKDSGPMARGVPFTLGSRAIPGAIAERDHEIMTKFRAAGFVAIGQTTAPELGLNFTTESVRYGATANPWSLKHSAGGSSGGSAAMVAAGAVPIAHGNDAAGSLRIPASCCGLVGLKPSRGRTPDGYPVGGGGERLAVEFGLTRTVRDTAMLLDATAVSGVLRSEDRTYVDSLARDPGRLTIGYSTDAWSAGLVDAQVSALTDSVASILEWIGHSVDHARPALEANDILDAEMLAVLASGAALQAGHPRLDRRRLEAVSQRVIAEAAMTTTADLIHCVAAQSRITRGVDEYFARFDLLLTPTIARLPARLGMLDYDTPGVSLRDWLRRILEYGPFTAPFNISGDPAMSLPLGESRDGLPIGVQLVAGRGREDLLLQVAAQLEQAMPWRERTPSTFAD